MRYAVALSVILSVLTYSWNASAQTTRIGSNVRVSETGSTFSFYIAVGDSVEGLPERKVGDTDESIFLVSFINLTDDDIESAVVSDSADGQPQIELRFTKTGAGKMTLATANNLGKRLAVIVDDAVVSAPTIRGQIKPVKKRSSFLWKTPALVFRRIKEITSFWSSSRPTAPSPARLPAPGWA